jgi:hypothetical protein
MKQEKSKHSRFEFEEFFFSFFFFIFVRREDLYFEIIKVETKLARNNISGNDKNEDINYLVNYNNYGLTKPPISNKANQIVQSFLPSLRSGSISSTGMIDMNNRKYSGNNSNNNSVAGLPRTISAYPSSATMGNRGFPSSYGGMGNTGGGRARRGAKFGDIGVNPVFLGLSDRCGNDPSMQQWYRRIRNTPNGMKLFENLRSILTYQRRRHNIRIMAQQTRRKTCPVSYHYSWVCMYLFLSLLF